MSPVFRHGSLRLYLLKLLDEAQKDAETVSAETLEFTSRLIEKKLSDFGVAVKVLAAYPKVLVPEMNMGQLSRLVRAEFLTDTTSLNKVQGLPFSATEIENKIMEMLDA